MGKKRKSDATRLDEVDRNMYSTFCTAASSLSQLYTQTMHQQRLSFQAGERHALEKLYNWIVRQQEDGNESEYGSEEPLSSPRLPLQQQQPSQSALHSAHSGFPVSFGAATVGQGLRSGNSDQSKNNVFSNALSSPVRRSLQHYHLTQGGYNANNSVRNNDNGGYQSRDPNPPSSNDTSMDMHADSPEHDSPY